MSKVSKFEDVQVALRALRPGVEVEIATGIKVLVKGVKVKDIVRFVESIGKVLPEIISMTARKGLLTGTKPSPADLVSSLIPLAGKDITALINECVEPVGIFNELDHDQAAPVIAQWVEMNLFDQGKMKAWKTAFASLEPSMRDLFPAAKT